MGTEGKNAILVALTGTVPVKVTADNGSIKPGDLLVSSGKPGYAMKCSDRKSCVGSIVGKALGSLAEGDGMIRAAVMLA